MKIMTTNTEIAINKKGKKYYIIKYDNTTNTKTFGKGCFHCNLSIATKKCPIELYYN
jgi:hypothetical protein